MSKTAGMALSELTDQHQFPLAVLKDVLSRLQSNALGNNDEQAKEAYMWQQVRYLENWLRYMGDE